MQRDIQIFSVRESDVGGGVNYNPKPPHIQAASLIILVHGYNDTVAEASCSYKKFLDQESSGVPLPNAEVIKFFWPGDEGSAFSLVNMAAYPAEIRPAQRSAELLGRFLVSAVAPGGWPLEITLICHSLGNRVALELMRFLLSNFSPIPKIKAACLMAAAVPVPFVDAGGVLRFPAQEIPRSLLLYSGGDKALGWAFSLGETVAGDAVYPSAVGHDGQPRDLWNKFPSKSQPMAHNDGQLYGHSDYWPGSEAFKAIAEFLNPALPQTPLQNSIAKSAGVESRSTPQRSLGSRSLI